MPNLTKTSWPLGWTPSQDKNGNPDGLLRMDNLRQDKNGALVLTKGHTSLNSTPFLYTPNYIYSKIFNNKEYIWIGLHETSKSVRRTDSNFVNNDTELFTDGGGKTVFGDAFGQVLIASGSKRKKDDTINLYNLGLPDPVTPATININGPQSNELTLWRVGGVGGSWIPEEYDLDYGIIIDTNPPWTNLGASIKPDPTTLRAILRFVYDEPYDTTVGPEVEGYDIGNDLFRVVTQLEDSYAFTKFKVEFLLDGNENYFWFEWDVQSTAFKIGRDKQSVLNIRRKEFIRSGTNTNLGWKNVIEVRFSAIALFSAYIYVGEQSFWGGFDNKVSGKFVYAYVYVNDNGKYIAKSKLSPPSILADTLNSTVDIQVPPIDDPQITGAWIFRVSMGEVTKSYLDWWNGIIAGTGQTADESFLDKYYKVGESIRTNGVFSSFRDNSSNSDLLLVNIPANNYLTSVQNIPEHIIDMEGLYNERMIYLTSDKIYLSDRLNPDAIDGRFIIKTSGDTTERNLWLVALSNSLLILATTKDVYEISGTLLDLPDGTIDVTVRPIGEKYPPLSDDVALTDGSLFYVAADGLRTISGSNSINISPQLRLLFQGESAHGIAPFVIESGDNNNYPIEVNQGKIYFSMPHIDGSRSLIIYDTVLKTYRRRIIEPIGYLALHETSSGKLLGGSSDKYLNWIDNGLYPAPLHFLTVYDHNNQPRNRKDIFTLKIVCNTHGGAVYVGLGKDGQPLNNLGFINSGSEQKTFYLNVSNYALGFRYAIALESTDLLEFELYEITLEYEPRPEQVNYLRIPNSNLGSQTRKRFTSFAFVIDTLGKNVTFTPMVDNIPKAISTVNKSTKLTNKHFFTEETLGTDIGGILQSVDSDDPFEFYGLNSEEILSEKLPPAVKYLVIPANDYGSPNRKRHTSYKFQINTRGYNVKFTPKIDGVLYDSYVFSSNEKQTIEYFFDQALDVVGIDNGGILETLDNEEFEFYGVIVPQDIEVLPPRLKSFYVPYNNFNIASRKRLRTLPIIIDTRGSDVIYTPIVDGVELTPSTLNSDRKTTCFHYFVTDVFGTDFGGILRGDSAFEFYGFGTPENVETLPVGKRYDQFQPLRFDKIGKLFELRTRIIPQGTENIDVIIYGDEDITHSAYGSSPLYSTKLHLVENIDNIYTIQMPKNINSSIFRIVLGPSQLPFHRYDMAIRVATSGMESDSKWFPIR